MKNEKLYDALLGIDTGYIERSDDFSGIRAELKRAKVRRSRAVLSVCGCMAVVLLTVMIGKSNLAADNQSGKSNIIGTAPVVTETESEATAASDKKENVSATASEVSAASSDNIKNNESDNTTSVNPVINNTTEAAQTTSAELKSEPTTHKPDDVDGVEETICFKGVKYYRAEDNADNFTIGKFIGTVAQLDSGNYYLLPDDEVYAVTDSGGYLAVRLSNGELIMFKSSVH